MFVSNIFHLMNPFPLGKHIFVASPPNVMIYMTMDAPKDGPQVFLNVVTQKTNDHAHHSFLNPYVFDYGPIYLNKLKKFMGPKSYYNILQYCMLWHLPSGRWIAKNQRVCYLNTSLYVNIPSTPNVKKMLWRLNFFLTKIGSNQYPKHLF